MKPTARLIRSESTQLSENDRVLETILILPPASPSSRPRRHLGGAPAGPSRRSGDILHGCPPVSETGPGEIGRATPLGVGPETDDDLLALDEAIETLAAKDPVKAQLVQLRVFAGLTLADAAGILDRAPGKDR